MKKYIIIPLLFFSAAVLFATNDDTCSVSFVYVVDGDTEAIRFANDAMHSSNNHIVSYVWDFGDGEISTSPNPIHSYKEAGSYLTCVTITTSDSCVSRYCDTVIVSSFQLDTMLTIAGKVFVKNNILLPQGFALLINNDIKRIEDISPVIGGVFTFGGLRTGNYLIYAIPYFNVPFIHFPHYLPTYYGNSLNWQHAQNISIVSNINGLTIRLISYDEIMYGNNTIKGTLYLQPENNFEHEFLSVNWLTDESYNISNKAINIPVLLLDEFNNPYQFCLTDENGNYSFTNIPFGKYKVSPEKAGLTTSSVNVDLIYSNHESTINFFMNNTNISTLVINNLLLPDLNIYPVPASQTVYIEGISNINIKSFGIVNIYGQRFELKMQNNDNNSVTIDVEHLPSGIYILQCINSNSTINIGRIIKQ